MSKNLEALDDRQSGQAEKWIPELWRQATLSLTCKMGVPEALYSAR